MGVFAGKNIVTCHGLPDRTLVRMSIQIFREKHAKTIGAWCAFCHIEERFYCKWRSRVDGCVRVVGIDG